MSEKTLLAPDLDFIRQLKETGGDTLKKCYQCATCSVVCKLSPADKPFPRKEMFWAQWGLKDQLLRDPDIWLCYQCNDCSTNCPREARPGDILAALRQQSFQNFAFPSFMGKALANPKAFWWLILIPVIVFLAILIGCSGGDLSYIFQFSGEVEYSKAFPDIAIDILFVSGNILIFAFAAIGLLRFWNNQRSQGKSSGRVGFIPALISTIIELLLHKNFSKCEESKPRYWGHMLIFFGFFGAFATTALVFLTTKIIPLLESPVNFPNPIKILGGASGIALFVGGLILIVNRRKNSSAVGSGEYTDWLFLNMIFLVGISGMLTWFMRLAGIPIIAYSIYFIHLVLVFFLLWYAPYSKFAHMFYRTLALIFAKSKGRDAPRIKS